MNVKEMDVLKLNDDDDDDDGEGPQLKECLEIKFGGCWDLWEWIVSVSQSTS